MCCCCCSSGWRWRERPLSEIPVGFFQTTPITRWLMSTLFSSVCVLHFVVSFSFFLLRLVNGMSRRGMSATERLWLIFISTPLQTPPYHPPPLSLPPARCHSFSRVIISDVICFRLFFLLLFSLFLSPFLRLFIGILDLRRSLARYQELVVIS